MGIEHKSKSECPAIILAVNRIARVNGRITDLISSIKTIAGTKTTGVPKGSRWAKKGDLFLKEKETRYPIHILDLIHLVKTMWLVPVKTKSKIPKKLFIKTKRKGPIMTKFKDEGINSPRVTLTSLFSDLQRLSDSIWQSSWNYSKPGRDK